MHEAFFFFPKRPLENRALTAVESNEVAAPRSWPAIAVFAQNGVEISAGERLKMSLVCKAS
ncbi:hypothetical protein RA11412_1272 [Rothia aeria]|uniref:Uncharacterized protein n=1 Tax=Rothia aeria TaxID=172042 RepID=A0A2Z5QZ39_9MICC|nr:hypothetical protein RA11412_1272 [Rothia aeria]